MGKRGLSTWSLPRILSKMVGHSISGRDSYKGECRYKTYGVLYQVDFYPGAYPGSMVKIEGHKPRWHGLQAVKINLVRILGKLDFNRSRTPQLYPTRTGIIPQPSLHI
jgi:hypothetical protein